MARKRSETERDQKSFDIWWSQRYFFREDPFCNIYKEIFLKGTDLNFIDCLCQSLLFADSLYGWVRETGARRRGTQMRNLREDERYVAKLVWGNDIVPTKGKLRRDVQIISTFMWDCVNFSRQQERKENWSSGMKETLRAHLLINYATNPEDFRSGGKSDRCGTFFLLAVTAHFRKHKVKPSYKLAATLLETIRGQQSAPADTEANKVKVRLDRFKKDTDDWQSRLDGFLANLHYLATT